MESKDFKSRLVGVLLKENFTKKGNYFYHYANEVICVVGMQKSYYSIRIYINVGYIIKELHPDPQILKDVHGDIRTRFSSLNQTGDTAVFDLEMIGADDAEKLKECFRLNIEKYIRSFISLEGLKRLLLMRPDLLYQTRVRAREFLGT